MAKRKYVVSVHLARCPEGCGWTLANSLKCLSCGFDTRHDQGAKLLALKRRSIPAGNGSKAKSSKGS